LLRPLGAVLGTALTPVLHALGVERAANDVIAHTGKILHAATTDHDDRVLLQVMTFTRDIAGNFKAVGKANTGNLTKGRVRLLRGRRVDASTHATLLRAGL